MDGENNSGLSISKRIGLLGGTLFLLAAAMAIAGINQRMRGYALEEARVQARIILDRNLAVHTYFSRQLKLRLMAEFEGKIAQGYFDPVWMSSTYAIREINKYAKTLSELRYYYKECAINARSPENEADLYERSFIRRLNSDPKLEEDAGVRTIDGQPYYVVLRRGERMERGCLRCHSRAEEAPAGLRGHYPEERSFGRVENEVVSAISIRVPLGAAYEHANQLSLKLAPFLLLVLACLYLLQHELHRRLLFAPLRLVGRKVEEIASNPERVGEELPHPGGRELLELTAAFNAMSVSLKESLDQARASAAELLAVNSELRLSEERYRSLLWSIRVAVVVYGADKRIMTCNSLAERLFGLSSGQLLGPEPPELFRYLVREDGTELAPEEFPLNQVLAFRQPLVDLIVGVSRPEAAEPAWVLVNADPVLDERGAIRWVIVTLVDISKRKRAEDKLRQLNDELEERVRVRTGELEAKNVELAKLNQLFVGRELRMSELKARIKELETRGEQP